MSVNISEFIVDLEKFGNESKRTILKIQRKTILSMHNELIKRTPVDTGRARASWGIEEGTPGTFKQEPAPYKKKVKDKKNPPFYSMTKAREFQKKMFGKIPEYSKWWIFNNLEYIEALENGSSTQASSGMLAISLAKIEQELEQWTAAE